MLGADSEPARRIKSRALADPAALAAELNSLHVADIVEALNVIEPKIAASVLAAMAPEQCIRVFDQAGLDHTSELICGLPENRVATILNGISVDRLIKILRALPEAEHQRFSTLFPPGLQTSLTKLLAYPPATAGGMMTIEFVKMPPDWTVEQGLRQLHKIGAGMETIYLIYVLDPTSQHLIDVVSLKQLILAEPGATIGSLGSRRRPFTVTPLAAQEDVARLISKYDLLAVPVVDETGQMVGIVTVDDVIDKMVEDATDEFQRFGGNEVLDQPYMQISFAEMIKKRAGWLCALFLSEMLTASAMQQYEGALEKAVVLTLFIPLIMSSGGNSGSQATSLIIRALAMREVTLGNWWRIAVRELPAGLTLGTILGAIGVVRIALWQNLGFHDYGVHWALVAATVGAALVGIVTFGSVTGSMLPFALKRLGFDPATASAPFVATLVDVTGLIIYFSIASLILSGTLL